MGKILIVDDDKELRGELSEMLEYEGYEIRTAADGFAALKAMEAEKMSVMILDLKMPVMDGYGVLRNMLERGIKLKTIVLTGSNLNLQEYGDNDRITLLGNAHFIMAKPFHAEDLLMAVKKLAD